MLINKLISQCEFNTTSMFECISSPARFNLKKFLESDVAAVCISSPSNPAFFVVALDGTICLVDGGRITQELSGFQLTEDFDLRDAVAQKDAPGFLSVFESDGVQLVNYGGFLSKYCLLAVNASAARLFGVDSQLPIASIADMHRAKGFCADSINNQLEAFSASLEEPLFCPTDVKNWSAADEADLSEVVLDICATDSRYDGEEVTVFGACPDLSYAAPQVHINGEEDVTIGCRAEDILSALFDVSKRFSGLEWEYSDGAASRQSGYAKSEPIIFRAECDPASEHERLAGYGRLHSRLVAAGKLPAEATKLLAV